MADVLPEIPGRPGTNLSMNLKVEALRERIQNICDPPEWDGEPTKAKYHWKLLRNSIKNAVDKVAKCDVKELMVGHGLHHGRSMNHPVHMCQMIYNKHTKEYLSVDSDGDVRIFRSDGRRKDMTTPLEQVNRILFTSQTGQYVGYVYGEDNLILMNKSFEVGSVSRADCPILAAVYNHNINEVITVGAGTFQSWVFRYGARHLLPRKTTTQGLSTRDRFEMVVLEDTASRTQRAFCVCGTSVAVFNVFEGTLLNYRRELHVRDITAILFFNPLKYLVTAARDGSIKVWDDSWHLQIVFVGHGASVTSLAIYPYGPLIMSTSEDLTLRVWSLETCDEVDRIRTESVVKGLGTFIHQDHFFSYSDYHGDLWKINQLHQLHVAIGHQVKYIQHTNHPKYPIRSVIQCRDASVRLVSPPSGDVLTTLLVSPQCSIVDAAYAIAEDTLFAVFADGSIIKSDTRTNPCTVVAEWKCKHPREMCNYLLVYEYVIDAEYEQDVWRGVKRSVATQSLKETRGAPIKKSNRTLLLGGRKDGCICVLNWESGEVDFLIEGHGLKGVLNMVANSKMDQLITAGNDNIIKVWRLFPFAVEALAPLMSFYCAHTPLYMTIMRRKLYVAFQDEKTATYSVVLYSLADKNRYDHAPDDDHADSLTGLACCPTMKLVASSSLDGTIRIWNEKNNLIRILKLNATPLGVGFGSQKGDLLVGIGTNVHFIDYRMYLPKAYQFRMISMHFADVKVEKPIPYNEDLLKHFSHQDVRRLKAAHSSFKFEHFVDILTEEETEEVHREQRHKDKMFKLLGDRDKELAQIRDGELKAKKKAKITKAVKRQAFEKYLGLFYTRTKHKLPKDDEFSDDEVMKYLEGEPEKEEAGWEAEREPTGFFPPASTARTVSRQTAEESSKRELPALKPPLEPAFAPINPSGFIPNSILIHLLWPPREEEEEEEGEEIGVYKPPQLSQEQLNQIASLQAKAGGKSPVRELSDRVLQLDYGDARSTPKSRARTPAKTPEPVQKAEEEEEEEEDVGPPKSNFMEKLLQTPAPKVSPLALAPDSPEPIISPPLISKSPIRPTKPIQKLISRPKPPPPPPPPREKTPPPPPATPLPEFIVQFKGQEWFEKFFPNANIKTFPKPWTVGAFVTMLLRVLRMAEWSFKVDVLEALQTLVSNETVPQTEVVARTVMSILGDQKDLPTCINPQQKKFIGSSLKLVHSLGSWEKDFYVELLLQFLEADNDVRTIVVDVLVRVGLQDPHGMLPKELDGWDTWNIPDQNRNKEIRKLCQQWLDKWLTTFKIHMQDSIEKIKRGQGVHGRVSRSQLSKTRVNPTPSRTSNSTTGGQSNELDQPGVEFIPTGKSSTSASTTDLTSGGKSRSYTVMFDRLPDAASIERATYLQALNYFCEMMWEKELEKMRRVDTKKADPKNTVLVLPKLENKTALVRLGETHTSKCRPHRETSLAVTELKFPTKTNRGLQPLPGSLHGFVNSINLPMKTINMNPFPGISDIYEEPQPILLTLRSAQKYFVPNLSYVPKDEQLA